MTAGAAPPPRPEPPQPPQPPRPPQPPERLAAAQTVRWQVERTLTDIRPLLHREGGDVELVAVADGVVSVRLQGACGSCPMALGTLTGVIEKRIRAAVPEIRQVRLAA